MIECIFEIIFLSIPFIVLLYGIKKILFFDEKLLSKIHIIIWAKEDPKTHLLVYILYLQEKQKRELENLKGLNKIEIKFKKFLLKKYSFINFLIEFGYDKLLVGE